MDIYQPRTITEEIISKFRPARLAIKELAGQLYFCKSINKNIERYAGSGVRWRKRIKKYGKENIKTLWVSDWYKTPQEIQEVALHFSRENQIVESEKWANIKPEDGLDGGSTSEMAKKTWQNEEVRNKRINNRLETMNKDDVRQKWLASINDPEVSKRKSESLKLSHATPEMKAHRATQVGHNAARFDRTIYEFIHKTGVRETCTQYDLRMKYNLDSSALSGVVRGGKPVDGWRLITTPEPVVQVLIDPIYSFIHLDGLIEDITVNGLVVKYNLNKKNILRVVRGKVKSHKGWSVMQR